MGERAEQGEALWYVGPGCVEIRTEPVSPPAAGEVRLNALYGGISRGTERLVLNGRVPASEHSRMRAPNMAGAFTFPVNDGYARVARIEAGPISSAASALRSIRTRRCSICRSTRWRCCRREVPASRALANMETALRRGVDAAPGPPTHRHCRRRGGGSLCAWLCAQLPGADVTLVDIEPRRAEIAPR